MFYSNRCRLQASILALEEVMGGPLDKEKHQDALWRHLGVVLKPHVATAFNFKEFSGIAAFVERIFFRDFSHCAGGMQKQGTREKR